MLTKQHTVPGQLSTSALLKHRFFPLNTSICVVSVSHHSSRRQLRSVKFPYTVVKAFTSERGGSCWFFFFPPVTHAGGLLFSPKANHRKSGSLQYFIICKRVNPEVNEFDANEPSNETLGWAGVHLLNHKGNLKRGVSQASQEHLREIHSWERAVSRKKENLFVLCPFSCLSEIEQRSW